MRETKNIDIGIGIGAVAGCLLCGSVTMIENEIKNKNKTQIPKIEYFNKDSLPDLVFKTGKIYLQEKEGNFVEYFEALKQKKTKLDSIYQLKKDSLKKIYSMGK